MDIDSELYLVRPNQEITSVFQAIGFLEEATVVEDVSEIPSA